MPKGKKSLMKDTREDDTESHMGSDRLSTIDDGQRSEGSCIVTKSCGPSTMEVVETDCVDDQLKRLERELKEKEALLMQWRNSGYPGVCGSPSRCLPKTQTQRIVYASPPSLSPMLQMTHARGGLPAAHAHGGPSRQARWRT